MIFNFGVNPTHYNLIYILVLTTLKMATWVAETCHWLFNYSMVQSTSWEPNWFAASQEIPRISRNPKVHYRTHKRPLPVSILGQPKPVHITTSHLLQIRPNIIHPSTPRSPHVRKINFMHFINLITARNTEHNKLFITVLTTGRHGTLFWAIII